MAAARKQAKEKVNSRHKTIGIWLEAVEDMQDSLNDWEKDFVASISEQFYDKGDLSPKQYDRLEEIYRKLY